METRDRNILNHIREYCVDIGNSVTRFGDDYEVFIEDKDFYYAVSMALLQIGELSIKLTDGFIEENDSKMPWKDIKNMRNRFAHRYGEMDKEIIWDTVKNSIPELKTFCEKILAPQTPDETAAPEN